MGSDSTYDRSVLKLRTGSNTAPWPFSLFICSSGNTRIADPGFIILTDTILPSSLTSGVIWTSFGQELSLIISEFVYPNPGSTTITSAIVPTTYDPFSVTGFVWQGVV